MPRGKEKRPTLFVLGLGSAGVPQSSARGVLTTALFAFCYRLRAWPRLTAHIINGLIHQFYSNNFCKFLVVWIGELL